LWQNPGTVEKPTRVEIKGSSLCLTLRRGQKRASGKFVGVKGPYAEFYRLTIETDGKRTMAVTEVEWQGVQREVIQVLQAPTPAVIRVDGSIILEWDVRGPLEEGAEVVQGTLF
jgi:hypothetical protein